MAADCDVLVLGGGAAGVAAALAARSAGARVMLVRAGPGASALMAGGWRGEPPARLRQALAGADYPLVESAGGLPHVNGFLDAAELAPPWHAGALPLEGALVVGVRGLPAFRASWLARAWTGEALGTAMVELPDTPAGGWSPVALAGAAERAPERLGECLGELARARSAARLLVPPLLGLERPYATWRAAADAAGVALAEAVGGTPSLPGWRLDRALLRALRAAGVEPVEGRAVGATLAAGEPRRVARVRLADGREIEGGAVVLATGKFAGGGIAAAPELREPALGLPIWLKRLGERFREAAPALTTELSRAGDQPLLRAGVHADDAGRPVDESGEMLLRNVRVAGSVRHGVDTATLSLGAAAEDGWRMGLLALEDA